MRLRVQKDSPDEEIRIKILQTLPLLIKPAAYLATPQFLSQMFEVCFRMLHDKSPIIQHTAEATVRQVRRLGHAGWASSSRCFVCLCMCLASSRSCVCLYLCSWWRCCLRGWRMMVRQLQRGQSRQGWRRAPSTFWR